MSEAIRLQLQQLLTADDFEYISPTQANAAAASAAGTEKQIGLTPSATQDRKNIHIEHLAMLTKSAIENDTVEDLNDVLHELEQNKETEIKQLCENNDSPLMSVADQLQQVNAKARNMKTTVTIVGQQIERSSQQLIEKVARHVHMKRTRVNIEESLGIVRLCLLALEHTNQVQELLKSNHKVAAVQNLKDLQNMELDELKHVGMGALIQQSVSGLSSEISSVTLNSLTEFFASRALKLHVEDVGARADQLTQKQRQAWDGHVAKYRHLRAFRFNSPVELAYRRSSENFLTDSQLGVDLGPLCEAEMVFTKLDKLSELTTFLETRFSRFSDDYLTVSDTESLLANVNRIVGFCLFDRICSNVLPLSRPSKLVDDTWEKIAQNISSVIGAALNGRQVQDYALLQRKLGMIMSTLQNFEFNVAIINDLFRNLLKRTANQIVSQASADFVKAWDEGEQIQYVCTNQDSYDDVLRIVWYDPNMYEDASTPDTNRYPKSMPFSEAYLITCKHLRNLLQQGVVFMEYFQQDPGFVDNTISSAIDRLLIDTVCEKMELVAKGENRERMVQTVIDLQLFESACKNIEQLLGKLRGATGHRGSVTLEAQERLAKAGKLLETRIHVLVEANVREILANGFDWTSLEPAETPSSTILEITTYMMTMANTILKRLPRQTRELTYFTLTENIGVAMCSALYDIPVDYSDIGLNNFDLDLQFLETSMSEIVIQSSSSDSLVEAHQIIELLRSPDPVKELSDPNVRNRKYGRVSQFQVSTLMQRLSKRRKELASDGQELQPQSSNTGLASPNRAQQQGGFMRYLSRDK